MRIFCLNAILTYFEFIEIFHICNFFSIGIFTHCLVQPIPCLRGALGLSALMEQTLSTDSELLLLSNSGFVILFFSCQSKLLSLQYKFYLKALFALHFLILLPLWTKIVGEWLFIELNIFDQPDIWRRLDLPAAYPWVLTKQLIKNVLKIIIFSQ